MGILIFDRRDTKDRSVVLQQVLHGLPLGLHVGNLTVDGLRPHHGRSKHDRDVERSHLIFFVSIACRLREIAEAYQIVSFLFYDLHQMKNEEFERV